MSILSIYPISRDEIFEVAYAKEVITVLEEKTTRVSLRLFLRPDKNSKPFSAFRILLLGDYSEFSAQTHRFYNFEEMNYLAEKEFKDNGDGTYSLDSYKYRVSEVQGSISTHHGLNIATVSLINPVQFIDGNLVGVWFAFTGKLGKHPENAFTTAVLYNPISQNFEGVSDDSLKFLHNELVPNLAIKFSKFELWVQIEGPYVWKSIFPDPSSCQTKMTPVIKGKKKTFPKGFQIKWVFEPEQPTDFLNQNVNVVYEKPPAPTWATWTALVISIVGLLVSFISIFVK